MSHLRNALLARLDPQSREEIAVHLRSVELQQGDVLADTHQSVRRVYFLQSGIVSCVVGLKNGSVIETGMIGRDGEFGAGEALDNKISLNKVIVQLPGTASVIDADRLRHSAQALPGFRELLIRYEQFFLAQVQQTAACNALHDLRARLCRWLLRINDLAGPNLPLTQESMAQMLGVRRSSITEIAGELQRAKLISYHRGQLRIQDSGKVRQRACECHDAVESSRDVIFSSACADAPNGVAFRGRPLLPDERPWVGRVGFPSGPKSAE